MTAKLAAALLFLALNYYTYNQFASEAVIPERARFDEFPLQLGEWSCPARQDLTPEVWKNLGATDVLLCDYVHEDHPEETIGVYVGYHATQIRKQGGGSGENSIHPPAHCLPGSGWDIIDNRNVSLPGIGLPVPDAKVKRLVIAKGTDRQLVYYWYQSRGRVIAEDWMKIVFVGLDRALRGRTDGALVRFTIPIHGGDEQEAESEFHDLAPQVVERLEPFVPL